MEKHDVVTWELEYALPSSFEEEFFLISYLNLTKDYDRDRIDWIKEDKFINIMIGDLDTFRKVYLGLINYKLVKVKATVVVEVNHPSSSMQVECSLLDDKALVVALSMP